MSISIGNISKKGSEFTWVLENIPENVYTGCEYMESPEFSMSHGEQVIPWRLRLYHTGTWMFANGTKYMSLMIVFNGNSSVTASFEFVMTNNNDDKTIKRTYERKLEFNTVRFQTYKFEPFAEKKYIKLVDDKIPKDYKLIISCKILHEVNICPIPFRNRLEQFNDFESMLLNEKFSDFTFIVEEKEMYVHKAILSCRSPVFEAMYKHDMQERNASVAEIKDMKYEVMKELLRFVYAGKVIDIQNIAKDLLIAADRYSIEGLKTYCEAALYQDLSIKNVLEYLKLSDTYGAGELKSQAMKFLVSHSKQIVDEPEFKTLGKFNEDLICEVVRHLIIGS